MFYIDDSLDILAIRQVAQDGEDDQPGKDGGDGVADAHNEGVSVTIVPELVVAGERQLAAVTHGEREENLRGRRAPDLR